MDKPAQKRVLWIAAALFAAAMLLFFIWLYSSLHRPVRFILPPEEGAAQQLQWNIFSVENGAAVTITGRAAYGEDAIQRFQTKLALLYADGTAYVLPTRMVGSEQYFDNSCFLALCAANQLPAGEAEIVILYQSDAHDITVRTGEMLYVGGAA